MSSQSYQLSTGLTVVLLLVGLVVLFVLVMAAVRAGMVIVGLCQRLWTGMFGGGEKGSGQTKYTAVGYGGGEMPEGMLKEE